MEKFFCFLLFFNLAIALKVWEKVTGAMIQSNHRNLTYACDQSQMELKWGMGLVESVQVLTANYVKLTFFLL